MSLGLQNGLPIQAILFGQSLQLVQHMLSNLGVIQELLHTGYIGRLQVLAQDLVDQLRCLQRVHDTDEDDV